jgi:uncharacterized membrane protein YfcA
VRERLAAILQEEQMEQIVICALIGALSGATSALFGVGGGIILVPAFAGLLHLEQKQAVATSLAVIVLTAVAATFKNQGNHLVSWKVAIPTALAGAAMAWFAAGWLKGLSNELLARLFGVLLVVVGIKMVCFAK